MLVENRDRYDDVKFLPAFKEVGDVEGRKLFLVGWDEFDQPVVATLLENGNLWASPLHEVIGHTQGSIVISEDIQQEAKG